MHKLTPILAGPLLLLFAATMSACDAQAPSAGPPQPGDVVEGGAYRPDVPEGLGDPQLTPEQVALAIVNAVRQGDYDTANKYISPTVYEVSSDINAEPFDPKAYLDWRIREIKDIDTANLAADVHDDVFTGTKAEVLIYDKTNPETLTRFWLQRVNGAWIYTEEGNPTFQK